MRTGTFSEAAVAKRVGETCVSAWLNKRPAMKIPDGLYKGLGWSIRLNNGSAAHNLTSVFAHSDGTVLHAAPGVLDAATFLEHLEFALALGGRIYDKGARRKDAEDIRAEAHRKAAETAQDPIRREAHKRMAGTGWTLQTFPKDLFDDLLKTYGQVRD